MGGSSGTRSRSAARTSARSAGSASTSLTASPCSKTAAACATCPREAQGWLSKGFVNVARLIGEGSRDAGRRARAKSSVGIVRWPQIGPGILTFTARIYLIQYLILRFANWF